MPLATLAGTLTEALVFAIVVAFIVAVAAGALYTLVRFVRWAWTRENRSSLH